MEISTAGCRLCLDPFADNYDSIDNLKEQMDKVFNFVIEIKQGYSSTVCQSCSYTVCEFYKYSEKVRANQLRLAGDTSASQDADDFKAVLVEEVVKVELNIPCSTGETVQSVPDSAHANEKSDLKEESKVEQGEDDDRCPSDDSYKPTRTRSLRRKRRRKSAKLSCSDSDSVDSEDDLEGLRPRQRHVKDPRSQEERNETDQQIMAFYRIYCDICCMAVEDYKSLCLHFRTYHNRKCFIVCCKRKLSSKKALLNHIAYHKNPNAFRCDQCNKSYKNLDYLELHKTNIHGNPTSEHPFKCDDCGKSYPKKYLLKSHRDSHKKIECQVCKKVLSSSTTLNAHMANMHSEKNRTMVCDFCGQEFLNKFCFERHVNEHNGIEVPKFQCQFCQKWYRGERNLQNHIEYTHNQKGRQFPCDICHQNYPNERAMKKHKRYVHVDEKYECEFCGKRFKQSVNLKEHRTTHTGEVLYSCDYCGVTKNSRANLYVHVKQKHPAEWAERNMQKAEANASV